MIAARTGVAVATVDSRIQRGLEKLRARLERERGRTEWLAALAPLAFPSAPNPLWPVEVTIVNLATKSALVAAAVVIVCVWWWSGGERAEHASSTTEGVALRTSSDSRDSGAAAPTDVSFGTTVPAGDTRVAQHASSAGEVSSSAALDEPRSLVRGRVIDVNGRALAGMLLGWEERDARGVHELGRSDGKGRFELAVPQAAQSIVTLERRWSTVLAGSARASDRSDACVVVAPWLDLAGNVVAADGLPVALAEIEVRMDSHFGAELGIVLDHSLRRVWRARSDANGRFVIADLPCVSGARIRASAGGFRESVQTLACDGTTAVRLVLERVELETLVRGVVLDPEGAPVPDARVGCGREVAVTDARGRFELDTAYSTHPIVATARGFQACVQELVEADGVRRWPEEVVLRLPGRPLSIAGRVLDRERKPLAGAKVFVFDPTAVGWEEGHEVLAENFAQRDGAPLWNFVVSDADGGFVIEGLSERRYELHALDPRTLASDAANHVLAGTRGVQIKLGGGFARVRGRVIARDGAGIGGVRVELRRMVLFGLGARNELARSAAVLTAEDGVFEFKDVPRVDVRVCAWGDGILPAEREVTHDADVEQFDVVAERCVHLQVEVDGSPERVDSVRVLDANGARMVLRVVRGEEQVAEDFAQVVGGRTQVLSLGEGAREVVLLREGNVVGRVDVVLGREGIHRVRW